jgi:DNA-binding transcriptional MerR regulator
VTRRYGILASMFTIGPFARLAGVSARVLRAYDALGLFRPIWVDRSTGYRYYSPAQLPELRRILGLRDVGVPLAEIGELVAGGADLSATLERRRADLERERRELDRRLAALDIRMAAGGGPDDVVVRPLAAELVATLDLALVPGRDDEAAFNELEAHVRDTGRRAGRPPGTLVAPDRTEIYVPLSRPIAPTARIGSRRLEAARAATVIHRGGYEELDAARRALERWVAAAGLTGSGDLRIVYLQFGADAYLRVPRPWLVDDSRDFVTELQLLLA